MRHGREVEAQYIFVDDGQVLVLYQLGEVAGEIGIELDRDDISGAFDEVSGERAEAGTDLERTIILGHENLYRYTAVMT